MPKKELPASNSLEKNALLKQQIQILQHELDKIQKKTHAFEVLLRSHLSDLIVEAQELFILYKQIKKAKKAKRLEQKKRGKNYKEHKGLQTISKERKSKNISEQQKEKKRLYREAMLHIHPDKFSTNEADTNIATEMTSRLIEIYKTENLETLRAYHAYIFRENTDIIVKEIASKIQVSSSIHYLQKEKEQLEKEIIAAKEKHIYQVLITYKNPLDFVDELEDYYMDRIFKLKKRTRKGL